MTKDAKNFIPDKFRVENSIANVGFLGMQVLEKGFPDYTVTVYTDPQLLQHCIYIGLQFLLSTFTHHENGPSAFIDIAPDIQQLLSTKLLSGTSQ